jgi:ABC-type dipeptide/oligopeptide/nickel transport system ATPase component
VASSQFVYEKIFEARASGAGVLLISSNLDEILGIADTVAVMYRGSVVEQAPAEDIYRRPQHEYTRALIGSIPGALRTR